MDDVEEGYAMNTKKSHKEVDDVLMFETHQVLLNFLSVLPIQEPFASSSASFSQVSSSSGSSRYKVESAIGNGVDESDGTKALSPITDVPSPIERPKSKRQVTFEKRANKKSSEEQYEEVKADIKRHHLRKFDIYNASKGHRLSFESNYTPPPEVQQDKMMFKSEDLPLKPFKNNKTNPPRPITLDVVPSAIPTGLLNSVQAASSMDGSDGSGKPLKSYSIPSDMSTIGTQDLPLGVHTDSESTLVECDKPGIERQESSTSQDTEILSLCSEMWGSIRSQRSSHMSVISLHRNELQALVMNNALNQVANPLQEELQEQWKKVEEQEESHLSLKKQSTVMSIMSGHLTPESEVARRIGIIGDEVEAYYQSKLDHALESIMSRPRKEVTYDVLQEIASRDGILPKKFSTWSQVVLLMLFSKQITMAMLRKGERGLGLLFDHTVRLIGDHAASFIINQGGWASIENLEFDESPGESDEGISFTEHVPEQSSRPVTGQGDLGYHGFMEGSGLSPPSDIHKSSDSAVDSLEDISPLVGDQQDGAPVSTSTMDDIRPEIALIRQVSEQFSEEMHNISKKRKYSNYAFYVLTTAFLGAAAIHIYQRLRR